MRIKKGREISLPASMFPPFGLAGRARRPTPLLADYLTTTLLVVVDDRLATLRECLRRKAVLPGMTPGRAVGMARDAGRRLHTLEHVIDLIAERRCTGFDSRGHCLGCIRQDTGEGCRVAGRTVVERPRIGRGVEGVRLARVACSRCRVRSYDRSSRAAVGPRAVILSRPVAQLILAGGPGVDAAAAVDDDRVPGRAGRMDAVRHFLHAEGLSGPAVVRFRRNHTAEVIDADVLIVSGHVVAKHAHVDVVDPVATVLVERTHVAVQAQARVHDGATLRRCATRADDPVEGRRLGADLHEAVRVVRIGARQAGLALDGHAAIRGVGRFHRNHRGRDVSGAGGVVVGDTRAAARLTGFFRLRPEDEVLALGIIAQDAKVAKRVPVCVFVGEEQRRANTRRGVTGIDAGTVVAGCPGDGQVGAVVGYAGDLPVDQGAFRDGEILALPDNAATLGRRTVVSVRDH
ncbi:MAG: hypothetical protein JRF07_01845 [Deltaproteobacteria bacterium]|nr:hypothetical protein [Deltaproteobacteria bacterium]